MKVRAWSLEMSSPDDVSQLSRLLEKKLFKAEDVLCIIGKTEGNGGVNDFTRQLAMNALENLFSKYLSIDPSKVQDRVIFSFSGGTEGIVTPHMTVWVREGSPLSSPLPQKKLAIGIGYTREFLPQEIGRMAQIEETARVIKNIATELKLDSVKDVHLVQMKGAIPSFTLEEKLLSSKKGIPLRSDMVYSRGASALGAALALDEVSREDLSDEVVCQDFSLSSSVASCSAKPGLTRTEVIVFANSPYWDGDLVIGHGVLGDLIDAKSIMDVAESVGVRVSFPPSKEEVEKIVAVFAKSEADPRGSVRGKRHTMLTDSDISDTRYSRCVLSSVLAAILGETKVYVSTRAEHHGPLGGGPLAIVARKGKA